MKNVKLRFPLALARQQFSALIHSKNSIKAHFKTFPFPSFAFVSKDRDFVGYNQVISSNKAVIFLPSIRSLT